MLVFFWMGAKRGGRNFFAVTLDPKVNKIELDDIPRTLKATYDGTENTLRDVYSENGAEALKECIESEKNIKFDKYICTGKDLLEKAVNTTGDISADFKGAVSFSQNGENFSFEKGENLLNPVQFCDVFCVSLQGRGEKDNKSELLKSFFKRLSGADFAPWQKKEFF
ncbi:MAG: hypothetical protein L6V93_09735 [Clostridiales bacterium]|nr:MAG: hypothetical protein L6V93_09735 [Clostridiales bacterium]